jgi:hypothetical protein
MLASKGSAIAEPFFVLEPGRGTDLLPAVNFERERGEAEAAAKGGRFGNSDLRAGVSAGLLSATATSGALIAIGSRAATVARPFNAIAGHVLGVRRSDAYDFVPLVTITGIALHVVLLTLAGIVIAFVARRRIAPGWLAATALATLSALVSVGVATRGGSSLARVLPVGDLVLFYMMVAISLGVGIRLAFFDRERSGPAGQM